MVARKGSQTLTAPRRSGLCSPCLFAPSERCGRPKGRSGAEQSRSDLTATGRWGRLGEKRWLAPILSNALFEIAESRLGIHSPLVGEGNRLHAAAAAVRGRRFFCTTISME